MHQYLLAPIEKTINYYIHLDTEISRLLLPLYGKIIVVELRGLEQTVVFKFTADGVEVLNQYDGIADVIICGTPLSLMHLSLSKNMAATLRDNNIELRGDIDVAMNFGSLFQNLNIDWEEYCSRIVGDPIAHTLGRFVGNMLSWGRQNCEIIKNNITEYLQEELKQFPTKKEVDYFHEDIDEMRHASERLSARVQRLNTLLSTKLGE